MNPDAVDWDEHGRRLDEIRTRIDAHPGYIRHLELCAFRRQIEDVFRPNFEELCRVLLAPEADATLAMELIQNVRPPIIRDAFSASVLRLLHNYLASAASLVDHSRRLVRGIDQELADEFEKRKAVVLDHPAVHLVMGLRNYLMHRALPGIGHTLSMTKVNTPEATMESHVQLQASELCRWAGWDTQARAYLHAADGSIDLLPIVEIHGRLSGELNGWLFNALTDANEEGRQEANELMIEWNEALSGNRPTPPENQPH